MGKNGKGKHIPYMHRKRCIVTIEDAALDVSTSVSACTLFDENDVKIDDWDVHDWFFHHGQRITVILVARDHRLAAALKGGRHFDGPGYIVITTTSPTTTTTTDPKTITVEPVAGLNPCEV